MSNLYHQLAEASKLLTEVNHEIAVLESEMDARQDDPNITVDMEKYERLRDEADDLEARVLDLEDEITDMEEDKHHTQTNFQ